MIHDFLMATRTPRGGSPEAESVVVNLTETGRLHLHLDDGEVLELDWDELLAIACKEPVAAARTEAA